MINFNINHENQRYSAMSSMLKNIHNARKKSFGSPSLNPCSPERSRGNSVSMRVDSPSMLNCCSPENKPISTDKYYTNKLSKISLNGVLNFDDISAKNKECADQKKVIGNILDEYTDDCIVNAHPPGEFIIPHGLPSRSIGSNNLITPTKTGSTEKYHHPNSTKSTPTSGFHYHFNNNTPTNVSSSPNKYIPSPLKHTTLSPSILNTIQHIKNEQQTLRTPSSTDKKLPPTTPPVIHKINESLTPHSVITPRSQKRYGTSVKQCTNELRDKVCKQIIYGCNQRHLNPKSFEMAGAMYVNVMLNARENKDFTQDNSLLYVKGILSAIIEIYPESEQEIIIQTITQSILTPDRFKEILNAINLVEPIQSDRPEPFSRIVGHPCVEIQNHTSPHSHSSRSLFSPNPTYPFP